jgi:hypothetical protein
MSAAPTVDPMLTVNRKALTINLDGHCYGTIAEIGAGQGVARIFFQVGGASGAIAKTISAYDMTFSDAIYGKAPRYVSRTRLAAMLDHEYELLDQRLREKRGDSTRFFVFADTVSAKNFQGTNECHGWMDVRFQDEPGAVPSEILLHVRMWDRENLQQQEAVGAVGVNLIYAAFHFRNDLPRFVCSLVAHVGSERVEVEMLAHAGFTTLISNYSEFHRLVSYFRRYTKEMIGVAPGINTLLELFNEK